MILKPPSTQRSNKAFVAVGILHAATRAKVPFPQSHSQLAQTRIPRSQPSRIIFTSRYSLHRPSHPPWEVHTLAIIWTIKPSDSTPLPYFSRELNTHVKRSGEFYPLLSPSNALSHGSRASGRPSEIWTIIQTPFPTKRKSSAADRTTLRKLPKLSSGHFSKLRGSRQSRGGHVPTRDDLRTNAGTHLQPALHLPRPALNFPRYPKTRSPRHRVPLSSRFLH